MLILIALSLVLAWLSSFRRYTTIGFDFETPRGPAGVLVRYDRVRWDAGSFWVGRAEQPTRRKASLDWWDPGGTWLARSIPPRPRSLWNRWGWWWIVDVAHDPYEPIRYPGATASHWVGVPGWLPVVLVGGWPIGRRLIRRRGGIGRIAGKLVAKLRYESGRRD